MAKISCFTPLIHGIVSWDNLEKTRGIYYQLNDNGEIESEYCSDKILKKEKYNLKENKIAFIILRILIFEIGMLFSLNQENWFPGLNLNIGLSICMFSIFSSAYLILYYYSVIKYICFGKKKYCDFYNQYQFASAINMLYEATERLGKIPKLKDLKYKERFSSNTSESFENFYTYFQNLFYVIICLFINFKSNVTNSIIQIVLAAFLSNVITSFFNYVGILKYLQLAYPKPTEEQLKLAINIFEKTVDPEDLILTK